MCTTRLLFLVATLTSLLFSSTCNTLCTALSSSNYHEEESVAAYMQQSLFEAAIDGMVREQSVTHETPIQQMTRKFAEVKAQYQATKGQKQSDSTNLAMTSNCDNLLSDFFFYFLTCHEFGINMDKICASYFVGWAFQGSDYPAKDSISDAPSICLTEYFGQALNVILDPAPYFKNVVFSEPYKQVCQYNCYQNYVRTATELLNTCYSDVAVSYPTLTSLYIFNTLYGVDCAENDAQNNCYDSLLGLLSAPTPEPSSIPLPFTPEPPFSNYNCTAGASMAGYCTLFGSQKCCFANQVAIIEQTPTSPNNTVLLPPCVARYLNATCPQVSLSDSFCTNGTNSNTSILSGFVTINSAAPVLPNMYNKSSVLYLQGVIAEAVQTYNTAVTFQIVTALNVEISNFVYRDASGAQLTTTDGINAPGWTDYYGAASGTFYFNLVQVYLSPTDAQLNAQFLSSPAFGQVVTGAYSAPAATGFQQAYYYPAQRFNTEHSGAASPTLMAGGGGGSGSGMAWVRVMCGAVAVSLLATAALAHNV